MSWRSLPAGRGGWSRTSPRPRLGRVVTPLQTWGRALGGRDAHTRRTGMLLAEAASMVSLWSCLRATESPLEPRCWKIHHEHLHLITLVGRCIFSGLRHYVPQEGLGNSSWRMNYMDCRGLLRSKWSPNFSLFCGGEDNDQGT